MNILVIGAKGFIGSHCVRHFKNCGHTVIGCDVEETEEKGYISLSSFGRDFNSLLKNSQFDCCINAAGSANVAYSFQYPEKDFELNVSLVINLLGAIKNYDPSCRFINFSSAAVYGEPKSLPVAENSLTYPLSPYGYHKLLSENLIQEYHRFFGVKTCSLRVFSAYGEGLKKQLFWDLYQKSLKGGSISLFGTGQESRDFIYINDLVNIVDLVLNKAAFNGEVYNVANGEETTISEATTMFLSKMNLAEKIVFSGEEKAGDPRNWKADIGKISALGYTRKYSFEEGVKRYCEWLKDLK